MPSLVALAVLAIPVVSPTVTSAADPATIDGLYSGIGQIGAGAVTTMTVVGRGGVPLTGVGAVALNVTATEPTAASFLTVWPTGTARPWASNLNFSAGQTVANAVIVKVGADGTISIFNNSGAVHVVVDVVGWFPANQAYMGVTPARLADTRNSPTIDGRFTNTGPRGQAQMADVTVLGRAGVPASGVGAVALNVTVADPTTPSFLTVWPTGASRPTASNLNFVPGQTVPNMVIAKVGAGGQVSIYNNTGSVDVVVDVLGWFPSGNTFTPLVPARVLDTTIDLVARRRSDNRRRDCRTHRRATDRSRGGRSERDHHQSDSRFVPHRLAERSRPTAVVEPQLQRRADRAEHGHRQARQQWEDLAVHSRGRRCGDRCAWLVSGHRLVHRRSCRHG